MQKNLPYKNNIYKNYVEAAMKIPCAKELPFIVSGLSFLLPELTKIQFQNLTLIATALILGAKFNLTQISIMQLKDKSVSTLSEFLSDAKISTYEIQHLYLMHVIRKYKIKHGYFIIDDTMNHHTKLCKWIHGASFIFDHVFNTNLNATCVVFLYYSDGGNKKCFIDFRIFYQEKSKMKWRRGKKFVYKKKYDLAIEMIEKAMDNGKGFPACTVLADSWFCVGPFIKELKRLHLSYVLEITTKNKIRVNYLEPKLTKTGKMAEKQYHLKTFSDYFKCLSSYMVCGFAADKETGQKEKALYNVKTATVRLNSIPGKHRLIESADPAKLTTKYILTDNLTWEAAKIISVYSYRWVIEEFFRNAKQLTDMEGATLRSKQGVTLALYLVSWIDFLLHYENNKKGTAGKQTKDSLTIPSMVRQLQYENLSALIERVQKDENFVKRWSEVARNMINRKRKKFKKLVILNKTEADEIKRAA